MTKQPVDDPENPEWTEDDFARAVPFDRAFPDLAESARRGPGRPPVARPKKQVSLRLDQDVIDHFKGGGPGWQTRLNDALRRAVSRERTETGCSD
ncbi:BrnA antitoxin family protein [uncultured Rhodospira sp.]|uniref:BrnA antitoxin family protein n=1 Tax=uncultured Rhodospira sp. TaxID=1936189 RepID=UPI00262DD82B|nr:BrnA antitoxin family protein [uncultured Rhodospira sp.]